MAFSPKYSSTSPSSLSMRSTDRPGLMDSLRRKSARNSSIPMPQIAEESTTPCKLRVAKLPVTANFGKDPKAADARDLRNTLLRISVYPVIHLVIAILGPLGSLILADSEHKSRNFQAGLYYLSLIGTAWIPFAYSCCAVFADDSLYNGLKEYVNLRRGKEETEDLELALGKNKHRWSEYANSTSGVDLIVSVQRIGAPGDAKDFADTNSEASNSDQPVAVRRFSQMHLVEQAGDDLDDISVEEDEEREQDGEISRASDCKQKPPFDGGKIDSIKE